MRLRFALIDNKLMEAKPGMKGSCPGCLQPVIAKCGTQRVHHWAHQNNKVCDHWWEPETEWHRSWKKNFPNEWHEVFLPDERTGEKHMADVRTSHGLVIEFQHSPIDSQERISREQFYKNMVWVVDGARLKKDYPRFLKGKEYFQQIGQGVFSVDFPDECFSSEWIGSSVAVLFDFRGNKTIDDVKDWRSDLYLLLPIRVNGKAIVIRLASKAFIDTVINGRWSLWVRQIIHRLQNPAPVRPVYNIVRRVESPYVLKGKRFVKRRRF